ncbi:diguanylate cyclase [Bacillus sp. B1-b2]|uniref:sensor domain-containing diguanylate cyclase n=1 Tax=Bacillus sp. B1-b2 TaxID=2653201 RepID=UPI001261F126|nr:diguanylate cyclase [Bacillus sp. B1-b2]KAB7670748.1 diguanylate cyclase [Bacillus sp. B1-b2]
MKYIKIGIFPFLALFIALSAVILYHQKADKPDNIRVDNGSLSLDHWDFDQDGVITLEGSWDIYWNQLLTPDSLTKATDKTEIDVPLLWKKLNKPDSYATYHLSINGLEKGQIYGLKMMDYFSAFQLWVDQKKLASSGIVGTSMKEEVARFDPQVVNFTASEETTDILIQVSNFHYREGGIWYPLLLGKDSQIHDRTTKQIGFEYILFFVLLIIGFIHIGQYLNRRSDIIPLWFGLSCITISIRSTAVGERILGDWFPTISMELMMKNSFFWYFLTLPLFLRFISSLYKEEAFPRINKYFTIFGILFSAIVILFPARIYSSILFLFNGMMPIVLASVLITIVRTVYHKRSGAKLVLLCMTVYSFAILYDILVAQKVIVGRELAAFGLLIFVLSQSYVTFSKFSGAFKEVDKVQTELLELNENLDWKIKERTKELITSQQKLIQVNNQLVHLSFMDGLTNVANRRNFNKKLEEYWEEAIQLKLPFSALLIDVDYFKLYNDNYGHLKGDEILARIAAVMQSLELADKDLVARYGGEEFAILILNKNTHESVRMAEELMKKLASEEIEHAYSKVSNYITVSIGVATMFPKEGMGSSSLILKADEALYKAKDHGRNTYKVNMDNHSLSKEKREKLLQ